ncbi:uncharacterized protein LOC117639022 [Thrips palmi]|uniref:Uncharacterized protein LOC117639022 n=1 Tax=Thrips palmi TaxID=161013 RepID=A0A6P8Y2H7_THRPL|nr:uncharacterized protein LOC117639022 [Thrips palmi]
MLLGIMLQSFYTSAIVSTLLKPIPRTIRSVQDLMSSPLTVGLEEFVYNRAVFQNSTDPLTSGMYKRKILPAWKDRPEGAFFSAAEGVVRVRRGGFAFGSEASTLYPPIENTFSVEEKCSLSEVELAAGNGNAAPIPKESPFKELFSRGYVLMLERGLRDRNRRRWSAPKPSCKGARRALTAVGLDPIFPAHALLLLGLVSAFLMLLHERCCTPTPRPATSATAARRRGKTARRKRKPKRKTSMEAWGTLSHSNGCAKDFSLS